MLFNILGLTLIAIIGIAILASYGKVNINKKFDTGRHSFSFIANKKNILKIDIKSNYG